jgi:outer membrane lipoprotein-sorting protein
VLLLFAAASSLNCSARRTITRVAATAPLRSASLEEVLAAYDDYCNATQTVSAAGDLEVRDLRAGKAYKVGVRLVASREGRLYLKGSVAVATALEVVSDGQRFWFQVPSKRTVWTGDARAAAPDAGTEQAPYYALRPADVVSAFLPEALAATAQDALVLEAEGEAFSLTLSRLTDGRGVARRRVWLARQTLLPVRTRTYDERGNVKSEVNLLDWSGGSPRSVSVERPAEGYQAFFTLSRSERNVAVPAQAFVPRTPADYKLVEVPAAKP